MSYQRQPPPKIACPMPQHKGCGHCSCDSKCFLNILHAGLRKAVLADKTSRIYQARQIIFSEGDFPNGFLVLCLGRVRLSLMSKQGRQLTIRDYSCGELFGDAAYLARKPHFFTAEAVTTSVVSIIPKNLADMLLARAPELLRRMAARSGEQSVLTAQLASDRTFKSANARVAEFLLTMDVPVPNGRPCTPKKSLTRRNVAEHVGLAPETVIRHLGAFKRRGFVKFSGKSIEVLNKTAMETVAQA